MNAPSLSLSVARRINSQMDLSVRRLVHRDEIYTTGLGAIDTEVIGFADIAAPRSFRGAVMGVAARDFESHCSALEPARLTLHAQQLSTVIDDEVVAGVFSERDENW
jgi:hypothetical protein